MHTAVFRTGQYREWNSFIAASPFGHILQSWEWGDIKALGGWKPVRIGLLEGNELCGAASVLVRQLPYGFGRLAYVPKGPVLDYSSPNVLAAMVGALRDLSQRERVISLKVEPELPAAPELLARLEAAGLQPASPVQMRSTIWVDLDASEEEIQARQKQKTRYNTRLAARKGVTVREATADEIGPWYRMYQITARRDGFTIHNQEYYELMLRILQPHGMATLLLAEHESELLAGIIVFAFGAKAQYMYGASSNEKRNLMAPYLVQWEGMRWAKRQGCTIYDLWGIPDVLEENEDLWGVYRHKRGYGGEIVKYVGAFDLVRTPWQHMALEHIARPLFKKASRLVA